MPLTAKPSLHDNDALLTYRVGPVLCCGPTLPIVTITPPPAKLTHPPGTNIAEPGIFKHGSDIVSATDLRYRFGVKQENWKQPGQVIIAKHDDLTRGYFVDEIIDVTHFPETGWGQLPAYLPRGVFSRTLVINKKIYLYAEFEKLSQLQGSGYLSDYIAHLEQQLKKNNTSIENQSEARNNLNNKEENTPAENKTSTSKSENKLTLTTDVETKSTIKKSSSENTANHSETKVVEKPVPQTLKEPDFPGKTSPNKKTKVDITQPLQSSPIKHQANTEIKKVQQDTPGNVGKETTSTDNKVKDSSKIKTTPPVSKRTTLIKDTNTVNAHTQSNKAEQENNAFSFLFIIIILALISGGGYYYFFALQPLKNLEKNTNINKYSDNIDNSLYAKEDITHKKATLTEKQEHKNNTQPALTSNTRLKTATPTTYPEVTNNNTQEKDQQGTAGNPPTEYRASINQDDTTITIELKGPLPPRIINISPEVRSETDITDPAEKKPVSEQALLESGNKNIPDIPGDKKTQTTKPQKKAIKDSSIEITHIIVKGDTLWAIAKHYLQNPFLYPELAKLSRIKNPDLIYPGNRVHIIYRAKNKTGQTEK